MTDITNDSGFMIQIWNDIKNGGSPLVILCFFLVLYFLKPYLHSILSYIGRLIKGKLDSKVKNYKIEDIKNHQIFKDLRFWLEIGIDSLRINNVNINYPLTRVVHKESEEYLKAKEDIAKDILRIKFETVKEYLDLYLEENPLEKIDIDLVTTHFEQYITKCEIKQYNKMLEEGIPNEFLKKYYIYEKMSIDLLKQNIKVFLDEKAFDIEPLSRLYLILNAINNYLTESYNTMLFTASSINGDLNGVEYKGNIIGTKKESILQPPHPTMVIPCTDKLKQIMNEFRSSRATLIKYYYKNNNIYHSAVYEVCANGIKGFLQELQEVPSYTETEVLNILKNHTVIAVDTNKFNNSLGERLAHRGIDATVIAPIFEGNDFSGILALDYLSLEEFEKINPAQYEDKIKEYTKELVPFISYPSDYTF